LSPPTSFSLSVIAWNWSDVALPSELIAVRQTMMIKASITAYSTAVGPSSETRKRCTFWASDLIEFLQNSWTWGPDGRAYSRTIRKKIRRDPSDVTSPCGETLPAIASPESLYRYTEVPLPRSQPIRFVTWGFPEVGWQKGKPFRHHPSRRRFVGGVILSATRLPGISRPLALRPGFSAGLPFSRMRGGRPLVVMRVTPKGRVVSREFGGKGLSVRRPFGRPRPNLEP